MRRDTARARSNRHADVSGRPAAARLRYIRSLSNSLSQRLSPTPSRSAVPSASLCSFQSIGHAAAAVPPKYPMGSSQSTRATPKSEKRRKKKEPKCYMQVLEVCRQQAMKAGLSTCIFDLCCAATIETTCTALRDRSRSRTAAILGSAPDASFAY